MPGCVLTMVQLSRTKIYSLWIRSILINLCVKSKLRFVQEEWLLVGSRRTVEKVQLFYAWLDHETQYWMRKFWWWIPCQVWESFSSTTTGTHTGKETRCSVYRQKTWTKEILSKTRRIGIMSAIDWIVIHHIGSLRKGLVQELIKEGPIRCKEQSLMIGNNKEWQIKWGMS